MQIINELRDIEELTEVRPDLDQLAEAVEEYFCELFDIFGDGDFIEDFRLDEEAGHIVFIETAADVINLKIAGIGEVSLKESCPEAIERIMLKDGKIVYKISICTNNSYMVTLFSIAGTLDAETEAWLRENSEVEKDGSVTAVLNEF